MVNTNTTMTVDVEYAINNMKLEVINEIFDFDVTDDYEFAISVLLEYATHDKPEDEGVEDALEEIQKAL